MHVSFEEILLLLNAGTLILVLRAQLYYIGMMSKTIGY